VPPTRYPKKSEEKESRKKVPEQKKVPGTFSDGKRFLAPFLPPGEG
jgi:hypothetical protein